MSYFLLINCIQFGICDLLYLNVIGAFLGVISGIFIQVVLSQEIQLNEQRNQLNIISLDIAHN